MLALVPSLTRSRTLFVIALTSHHTHVSLTSPPHSLTTLFVIAVSIMFVLPPSLTHSACDCTYHHVCSLSTSHSVSCACTHYNSLTLCACDYTHHDVCLCPLTHTLCLWLHSPRCILTLTVIHLWLHSSLRLSSPIYHHFLPHPPITHSVALALTSMHVLTLSPTHSVCNHMYGWPSPSHSLTTLFAIVRTVMLALSLSLTHSLYDTYDCTYYRVCLPSSSHVHSLLVITLTIMLVFTIKNEKRGWSGEGGWCWGIGSLFVMK